MTPRDERRSAFIRDVLRDMGGTSKKKKARAAARCEMPGCRREGRVLRWRDHETLLFMCRRHGADLFELRP